MRVSTGAVDIKTMEAYLALVKKSPYQPEIIADITYPFDAWNDPYVTEAFHRLSTCMESCGCTGYNPKDTCLDINCYCNRD